MDLSTLFSKYALFMILIAFGYLMSSKGILTDGFNKGLGRILILFFVPASVINSVLGDRPAIGNSQLVTAIALLFLAVVVCYIIAFIYSRLRSKVKGSSGDSAVTELLMAVTNNLFIGLPVMTAFFGDASAFYMGLSCIPFNIMLFSYGVWRLKGGKEKIRIKDVFNSCFISSLVALLIFAMKIRVPAIVSEIVGPLSSVTVPMSMLLIGSTMGKSNPFSELAKGETWIFLFFRLIVSALVVFSIISALSDNRMIIATCTVLAGCPCGIMVTTLALQYGHDAQYTSKLITSSTLVSLVTLPLLLMILF